MLTDLILRLSLPGYKYQEEVRWKSRNGSRTNAHTASFLAPCILGLIKWIY